MQKYISYIVGLATIIVLCISACAPLGTEFEATVPATQEAPVETPEIRLLQWNHFVPQYDKWFDPFAKAWGDEVGVNVEIEHVGLTELPEARLRPRLRPVRDRRWL